MSDPKVHLRVIHVCDLCLRGVGGFCNVPGCLFCRYRPVLGVKDLSTPIQDVERESRLAEARNLIYIFNDAGGGNVEEKVRIFSKLANQRLAALSSKEDDGVR